MSLRPRSLGPLASILVAACSSGAERDDRGSSASLGEASDGSGSNATQWSGGDPTSTTGDPSASGTTPADTTADDPSAPTSTDDPSAPTSTDDTTGGPPLSCAEDDAACNAWFLPPGATQWEAVVLGGPAALAPSGVVLAAFDIEAPQLGFVVTSDEVVRVDLAARTWESKESFADLFGEVNVDVVSAYSVPAYWGNAPPGAPESVAFTGTDVAFLYRYDEAADTFEFDQAVGFGDEWSEPGAPAGASVREMWLDVTNAEGWIDADASRICSAAEGPIGPYMAIITDEVHVLDGGYCFEFFPAVDYAAFTPTGYAGTPAVDRIGGALYNEATGLTVFAP